MKKVFAVMMVLAMALCMIGCSSLFSDNSIVKFDEVYTHKDPQGLSYTERMALMNKNFGSQLVEMVNAMAYPDTMKYDGQGNMVGMYEYDENTGMASGWYDLSTGAFVAEEIELGKPDESLMLKLNGTVTLCAVVYGKDDKCVGAYVYTFLSDKADKDAVLTNMSMFYGMNLEAESDTMLACKMDEAAVNDKFEEYASLYGEPMTDRSAAAYADTLKIELGLRNYGVNPFKPTTAMKDPEGLQYDTKQVLTSNGTYSFVDESLEKDMKVRTDVIYGYQGKAVAHYTYYEYNTKEAADKLVANATGNMFSTPERVSDTVVMDFQDSKALEENIALYIGYNVMTDDSYDSYVTNVEDSYFLMRYEN